MAKISKEMTPIVLEGEGTPSMTRFLQVRDEIEQALATQKYPIRVDMTWEYPHTEDGMPNEETLEEMEVLEDNLLPALEKNNLALLTYKVTGEHQRIWCFYTRNLRAFEETLNSATEELPLYPLTFYAEEDKESEAYKEVKKLL